MGGCTDALPIRSAVFQLLVFPSDLSPLQLDMFSAMRTGNVIPSLIPPQITLPDSPLGSCGSTGKERFAAGDVVGAYEEYLGLTDVEEKTGLWSLLDSKVRSAIKKHGETLKG